MRRHNGVDSRYDVIGNAITNKPKIILDNNSLPKNPHHSASHSQPTHTPPFICVVRREAHDGAWPVRTVGTHSVTYVPVARYTCRSRGHA